jgi:GINS complex subunit 4
MLDLEQLIQAYTNEKATKKLLLYDEIVDRFNFILKSTELNAENNTNLLTTLEEIELERIKYFVKEYILTRLEKIRNNIFLDERLMSIGERRFFEKYKEILTNTSIYANKPSKEYEIVGFIVRKAVDNVIIDGQMVKLSPGDFFVANYDDIIDHLNDGSIVLV